MQVKRPIILHIPGFFADELERKLKVEPPKWKYEIFYFYYLAHYLTVKQIQQKKNEFFSINILKLRKSIVWNIDKYIMYLIKGELLKRDNYTTGQKAYHYKINPEYLSGYKVIELNADNKLFSKIVKSQRLKRTHANRMMPFLKQMNDYFFSIDFDYVAAKNWIESQPNELKKNSYLTALAMLEDKRFRYFKRNKTNKRLDTNLTNLKSELRQFIKGDYVSIDLANSQPFILSQILAKIYFSLVKDNTKVIPLCMRNLSIDLIKYFGIQSFKDISKFCQNDVKNRNGELLNFKKSCLSGKFYDDFLSAIDIDGLNREHIKKMMFAVLFSQNVIYKNFKPFVPYRKEKTQFAGIYPTVYKMVFELKKKNHAKLAILLQRIESQIFIDTICPGLVELGVVPITIHDSIIVEKKHLNIALNVVKKEFENLFGDVPSFHVKSLKTLNNLLLTEKLIA